MSLHKERKSRRKARFISGAMKESITVLFISSLAAIIAGLILGRSKEVLLLLPGLIILLPGAIDIRGSIFAALGSRLSSDMHLGIIKKFSLRNRFIRGNIHASLTMGPLLSIVLGILAWTFSRAIGIESISVYSFILIAVIGGLISSVILLGFTFIVSFKAFKRNWDPDNITAPLITTFGDFFTIPALLFAADITLYLSDMSFNGFPVAMILSGIIISVVLVNLLLIFLMKCGCKRIVFESLSILLVTAVISTISGIFIEPNIETFVTFASLLVILPAFIGQCGNIGNILASRLATKLHLGTIKPGFKFNKAARKEILSSYKLCLFVFPLISVLAFVFSFVLGISTLNFLQLILITTLAGVGVVSVLIFVSFTMAIVAFRFNMDPDNVMIPVVSVLGDLAGVLLLLAVLTLSGFI